MSEIRYFMVHNSLATMQRMLLSPSGLLVKYISGLISGMTLGGLLEKEFRLLSNQVPNM